MYGHQGQQAAAQAGGQTSRVEGAWRISPSGHTVVAAGDPHARGLAAKVETRHFFATQEIVHASNVALERMGSPLRLETSADVPAELHGKGLLNVSPVLTLVEDVMKGTTKQTRGDGLLRVSECSSVADLLAGEGNWRAVYRTATGEVDRIQSFNDVPFGLAVYPRLLVHPHLDVPGLVEQLPHDNADYYRFTWRTADGVDKLIDAVVSDDADEEVPAKTQAAAQLVAAGLNKETADTLMRAMSRYFSATPVAQQLFVDLVRTKAVFGAQTPPNLVELLKGAYGELKAQLGQPFAAYDDAPADARRAMAQRFGVNEAVAPHVGEVFAITSTREWTAHETVAAAEAEAKYPGMLPWTYHLAIVVAVDGGARITLENYNRQNDPADAAKWYFSMYGPEPERLFHTVHAPETGGPVTLVLRKPAS